MQGEVLRLSYSGKTDKQIAGELGGKSPSTVRNHQFQLRNRKKEAKIFLALMALLEDRRKTGRGFVEFHGELSVHDDRIVELFELDRHYTEKEVNNILALVHSDYGLMTRTAGAVTTPASDCRRLPHQVSMSYDASIQED